MKKQQQIQDEEHELEIIKAVAQAWHGNTNCTSTKPTSEFDAHRRNFKSKPTRFKLEAMNKASLSSSSSANARWDFGKSLWDSYEILDVSKKVERGLALDCAFDEAGRGLKRLKESKHSLRKLFARSNATRFNEDDIRKG